MGLLGMLAGARSAEGPYRGGILAASLGPDSVRTLGCLDVGFVVEQEGGELLDVYLGNRCVHSEALDLSKLILEASYENHRRWAALDDPRHEIVLLHVGGSERGKERIRIRQWGIDRLCLHVDEIAPDAHEARPAPVCFRRGSAGWVATG
jgi:hypothetical protein